MCRVGEVVFCSASKVLRYTQDDVSQHGLFGTLVCTNFRVAFVSDQAPNEELVRRLLQLLETVLQLLLQLLETASTTGLLQLLETVLQLLLQLLETASTTGLLQLLETASTTGGRSGGGTVHLDRVAPPVLPVI